MIRSRPPGAANAAKSALAINYRPRRFRATFAVGLCVWLLSNAAAAQNLICASHALDSRDRDAVVAVARAAFGAGAELAPTEESYCRNLHSARAWFETTRHVGSEGALEWYFVSCMRERKRWVCEAPILARELEIYIPVSGRSRHFVINLDPETSVALVRTVLPQASAILFERQLTHPPACSPGPHDEQRWADNFGNRLKAEPTDDPIRLDARTENGALTFGLDLVIRFRPDPAASDTYSACWYIQIIVT